MVGVQVLPTLCFYHHYMCIYADLVRQYDELKLKDNKFYDVELPRFSQASTVYTRISIFYTLQDQTWAGDFAQKCTQNKGFAVYMHKAYALPSHFMFL